MAKLTPNARNIESYAHADKQRLNNPPVGLVTPDTDKDVGTKTYAYDPHLDPQLTWAGKVEHTRFAVPTVSLHVHERIDPRAIIDAVRQQPEATIPIQPSLFDAPIENLPIRQAIEFYKHKHNWSNRLIAGDSLLVMNSLLEKEGMAGQVQVIFIDPPYGIKYGSNFQPFVNNRNVKDGNDEDLTTEPETIKAFRDTWELGIHSYLTYLRDRLLLSYRMLHESGSVFVQIGEENLHLVRSLLDEVFLPQNHVSTIPFRVKSPLGVKYLGRSNDYLLWYSRNIEQLKYNQLFLPKNVDSQSEFSMVELEDGTRLTKSQCINEHGFIPDSAKYFTSQNLASSGYTPSCTYDYSISDNTYGSPRGKSWKTTYDGMEKLRKANRLIPLTLFLRK